MDWSWLAEYGPDLLQGFWLTLKLLIVCSSLGMLMAIVIGLVQVTGPKFPAAIARGFCTYIRGTPLLIQLWLIYYGLGELFPQIDGIKDSFIWPLLRAAIPYAIFAFTLSVAGYVGEIMRGAFAGVPKGELEAARAMGMSPFKVLMRVWLPRALQNVFPTLAGELVLTLKATPLAATLPIRELFGEQTVVRQETFLTYEPLLLVAGVYILLTGVIVTIFGWLERRIPTPPRV